MRSGVVAAGLLGACAFDPSGVPGRDAGQDPGVDAAGAADATDTSLALGDVRLAFGELSSTQVELRRYSMASGDWMDEPDLPNGPGQPLWLIARVTPEPVPDELLVGQVKTLEGCAVAAWSWLDGGWGFEWSTGDLPLIETKRGFDVELEHDSGDALAVWSDGTATPQYRTRVGDQWSEPQPLPVNDSDGPAVSFAAAGWIELEPRRDSDDIALVWVDENRVMIFLLWDGDEWQTATARALEYDMKSNALVFDVANRSFDLAWEAGSGDLVVAWARNSATGFHYSRRRASDGQWNPDGVRIQNVPFGFPHFVDLAADPKSDLIAGGFFDMGDGTERAGAAMWNGDDWTDMIEIDSQARDSNDAAIGDMPGGVSFIGTTGNAVLVYADAAAGTLDWADWTEDRNTWMLGNDFFIAGKGDTESVQLVSATDSVLLIAADPAFRLYAATFHDGEWQLTNAGAPLTSTLSGLTTVPFAVTTRP